MKKTIIILLFFVTLASSTIYAQRREVRVTYVENSKEYGNTLNLGLGIGGYSNYYGHAAPVLSANYEFDVARNFTLAPFATFYSYRDVDRHYRTTIIPVGVKGSLYLDQLLHANSQWDFYVAGSLGFSIVKSVWDDGYYRDTYYHEVSPLFLDLHIGTEVHLSNSIGLFLDLSTGISTIGLAIH